MADKREEFIRKMIAEGTSDDDIRATLKVFDAKQGMSLGESVTEVGRGVKDEVVDQAKGVNELAHTLGGIARNLIHRPETRKATASGFFTGAKDALTHPKEMLTAVDPTGIASLVQKDESGQKKVGRGITLAGETLVPFLKPLQRLRGLTKAGDVAKAAEEAAALSKVSSTAETLGDAGALAARTSTETTPIAQGPLTKAPAGPQFTLSRPVEPKPRAVTGTGSTSTGMQQRMSTPPAPGEIKMSVPVDEQAISNGALKAEDAAELAKSGKPSYSGTERRGSARIATEAEDVAYKNVREAIERKNAKARAQAALMKPAAQPKKTSAPLPSETDVPPAPKASVEVPKAGAYKGYLIKENPMNSSAHIEKDGQVIARPNSIKDARAAIDALTLPDKSTLAGFTRQPTKSLEQMVSEYGREGAATRAGMTPDELDVRIDAGGDPAKLAKGLRDKFGAEKAARMLGENPDKLRKESGGAPSRLPERAVAGIKAAAEKELARDGKVSEKTQGLLDQIDREAAAREVERKAENGSNTLGVGFGPIGEWIKRYPKTSLSVAGGTTGALIGSSAHAKNDDDRIGNTVLGAMGGATLGALPSIGGRLGRGLLKARTEGFLSGGAIPKNIGTALGAPITVAAEGGGMKPLKEMLRLPTNAKVFMDAMRNPASQNKYGDVAGPLSKTIGAIDHTATKALTRGGVTPEAINELLLTGNSSLFSGAKVHPELDQFLRAGLHIAYPFQRVPLNLFSETIGRGAKMVGAKMVNGKIEFGMPGGDSLWKTALDVGATGGGYALANWSGKDPKKLYMANIALSLLGPRAGLATVGMMSKLGRQAVGGISPIPEQNADLKSFIGWPPSIWKVAKKFGAVR